MKPLLALILAVSCAACDLATQPTRVPTTAAKASLGRPGSATFYVDGQLGKAQVTNTTGTSAVFMFALFDATNPDNQVDLQARDSRTLAPGDSVTITVGLHLSDHCKPLTVQPDIWINPPPVGGNGKYTLGELTLYAGGSTQTIAPTPPCGSTPPPPPPPPCVGCTPTPTCVPGTCAPPVCTAAPVTYTFPPETKVARVPPPFMSPPYPPEATGMLPLLAPIPAGQPWAFRLLSGDPNHADPLTGDQLHEVVVVEFYAADGSLQGTSDVSVDVPQTALTQISPLGTHMFAKPVWQIRVIDAAPPSADGLPTDSVQVHTLTWGCP